MLAMLNDLLWGKVLIFVLIPLGLWDQDEYQARAGST